MSASAPLDSAGLNEGLNALHQEYQRAEEEFREVELMQRQIKGETETLNRRDMQMNNRLRQIEGNLENYSREEIKEIYHAVRDSQMRLFMMRSQVEQLDHKRSTLSHYLQQLQKVIDLLQSVEMPAESPSPTASFVAAELTPQQTILRIINRRICESRTA